MNSGRYPSDLTNSQWLMIRELLPARKQRGLRRRISLRAVMNAIFYLLRTGCQWRQLPAHGLLVFSFMAAHRCLGALRALYRRARVKAGRAECPSVVIMDGQSVKATEIGAIRGFDAFKRVKGRKRHILVDTLGLPIANRVEAADISDRRTAALLTSGLKAIFPAITTVIADAGHESGKLAHVLAEEQGWQLHIVKRRQPAFKITGLTWIVERSFAWLGCNRRLSKDYESVQTSETMIYIAAARLMLNRLAPC